MPDKFNFCYAREFLYRQGFVIKANDAKILNFVGPVYDVPKIVTKIAVGQKIAEIKKIIPINTIEELNRHGIMIISEQSNMKGLRVIYRLRRFNSSVASLLAIPKEHRVEWAPANNAFRIIGKKAGWSGVSPWFVKGFNKQLVDSGSLDSKMRMTKQRMIDRGLEVEDIETLEIPEIPVMISTDGKIVCLMNEMAEPVIGIVGERRNGNSLLGHRICDLAFHKWGKRIAVVNDLANECGTWCTTWRDNVPDEEDFKKRIERIGEPSVPLPAVYLKLKNSISQGFGDLEKVGYYVSIPFEDMIRKYGDFMKGNKGFEIAKTLTHFQSFALTKNGVDPRLMNVTSWNEFDFYLMDNFLGGINDPKEIKDLKKNKNANVSMYEKMKTTMKVIWDYDIVDIANQVPSKWEVFDRNGNNLGKHYPWNACLIANLVPVMQNEEMTGLHFFQQWQKFVMTSILDLQKQDSIKKMKMSIWIFNDEILGIAGKKQPLVADVIDTMIRICGPYSIGFIYRAQYFDHLPTFTRANTGYLFCSAQKGSADAICKEYRLDKSWAKILTRLKPWEFVLIANGKKIVTYDPMTGEREVIEDNYPIKGRILPSLSRHKAPK